MTEERKAREKWLNCGYSLSHLWTPANHDTEWVWMLNCRFQKIVRLWHPIGSVRMTHREGLSKDQSKTWQKPITDWSAALYWNKQDSLTLFTACLFLTTTWICPLQNIKSSLTSACHPHQSRSCLDRCRCTGGGSWPGSRCLLCPIKQRENGSSCHAAHWSPTRTQCCSDTSLGIPERTESHSRAQVHWGHSHHLWNNKKTVWFQETQEKSGCDLHHLKYKSNTTSLGYWAKISFCWFCVHGHWDLVAIEDIFTQFHLKQAKICKV